MKKKKISFKYKGKKICLDTLECNKYNILDLGRGLTFRRREHAPILLFNFGERVRFALTGLCVFFPFFVIWLDEKNNVLEVKRVKPFTFHINTTKPFTKIIEIPISKRYMKEIKLLVGK